jgi:hypothetical protein
VKKVIYTYVILCFSLSIYGQGYNTKKALKDYGGTTIITTQVRAERNKGILRGTEAPKKQSFCISKLQWNTTFCLPSIWWWVLAKKTTKKHQ